MTGGSHRATRAPVGVHTTPWLCTPHTTSALTRSPHLKGLASSRQPRGATRGQEGDARVGPPPHTLATHRARTRHGSIAGSPVLLPQYIHSVHSWHGTLAGSPPPVHPLSTIIEAAAPVEGGRVGNQWAATVPPPSDRGAPATPGGGRRPRPPPRAASPTQSRATRVGPIQTRGQRTVRRQRRGASPQKPRMHAGEIGPRRTPICPRGQDGRTHAPPLGSPAAALRRARPPPSDLGRAPHLDLLTVGVEEGRGPPRGFGALR